MSARSQKSQRQDQPPPAAGSPAQRQAEKLLDRAGSPEQAQQALDRAAHTKQAEPPQDKDAFARQWGFESYLEMFEAATTHPDSAGHVWCIAAIPGGRWLVWREGDLQAREVAFLEEAKALARGG